MEDQVTGTQRIVYITLCDKQSGRGGGGENKSKEAGVAAENNITLIHSKRIIKYSSSANETFKESGLTMS